MHPLSFLKFDSLLNPHIVRLCHSMDVIRSCLLHQLKFGFRVAEAFTQSCMTFGESVVVGYRTKECLGFGDESDKDASRWDPSSIRDWNEGLRCYRKEPLLMLMSFVGCIVMRNSTCIQCPLGGLTTTHSTARTRTASTLGDFVLYMWWTADAILFFICNTLLRTNRLGVSSIHLLRHNLLVRKQCVKQFVN